MDALSRVRDQAPIGEASVVAAARAAPPPFLMPPAPSSKGALGGGIDRESRQRMGEALRALGKAGAEAPSATWRNWPGLVEWSPSEILEPTSTHEVQSLVQRARAEGRGVRVVGGGNSWSDVTRGNDGDLLLETKSMNRVRHVERLPEGGALVTVEAGISLAELTAELEKRDLSIRNLPAVLFQTLGGMIATNSHGSSWNQGGFATMVDRLVAVDGRGERIEASAKKNPEVFNTLCAGLGLGGIITEVTLRVDDVYNIATSQAVLPMTQLTDQATLDRLNRDNDWFMFVVMPYTGKAHVTLGNRTEAEATGRPSSKLERFALNYLEPLQRKLCTWFPSLIPACWRLAAKLAPTRTFVEQPHRALPFIANETPNQEVHTVEYFFPAEHTAEVLKELGSVMKDARENEDLSTKFYTMVRFVRSDDSYLSYAYSEDPEQRFAALSIPHQNDPDRFYPMIREAIDRVLKRNGEDRAVSVHLGKSMIGTTSKQLRESLPKLDAFMEQRDALDPEGVFRPAWFDEWFGTGEAK